MYRAGIHIDCSANKQFGVELNSIESTNKKLGKAVYNIEKVVHAHHER